MFRFDVILIPFGLFITVATPAPQYSRGFYPEYGYPSDYDEFDGLSSNSNFGFHSEPDRIYPIPDGNLVPPIYEDYDFRFIRPEQVTRGGSPLERGRSDIDPIEDNEGLGYFYPRPKIAFDLPKPLDGAADSDTPDESTETTTALDVEETTVTQTTLSPPSSSPLPPPPLLPTSTTKNTTESDTGKVSNRSDLVREH